MESKMSWNHHLSFPKISQLPHSAFTLRATGPEVRRWGSIDCISDFCPKNPWKNSLIPIHTCRVCYTYRCSVYIYICVPMYSVLYVSLIYMYMWDIQNYASSSLYSCIFIILYGEIISIILKDAYTIQKHITFPRTEPRALESLNHPVDMFHTSVPNSPPKNRAVQRCHNTPVCVLL